MERPAQAVARQLRQGKTLLGSGRGGGNLLHQRQLVPIVPATNDLAILDLRNGNARYANFLVGRPDAEVVAGMSHYAGPTDHDAVVRTESVFDGDFNIWKRAANAIEERHEITRPA